MSYSRYIRLISNGKMRSFPKIVISNRSTDIFMTYDPQKTRLDRIAFDVYSDDTLYWIILLANPQYYSEFDITARSVIRIPMPLNEVITEITNKIDFSTAS